MAVTGNIGEWSEIYTLLKVLGDKKLFAGDENIEKIEELFYPIISVLRTEANGKFEYILDKNIVLVNSNGSELLSLPVSEFAQKATDTLEAIKENKRAKNRTFSIPEIEAFMQQIHCSSLKASSSAKTDITIIIHDQRTNNTPELGFSIKSQLGGASTLLNAGKTTNFQYKVLGLTEDQIIQINEIDTRSKIKDRLAKIRELGGTVVFEKPNNAIFNNNLILIDSLLPHIIAVVINDFYSGTESKLDKLISLIEENNPLKFDKSHSHLFYTYKIKKFLTDAALGMMPSKVWSGHYDATGGYLVVKEDGDVLCYHLYNRNEFEQYLLSNTKLETASSTRHEFGSIYNENNEYYINLNLQIRFIK